MPQLSTVIISIGANVRRSAQMQRARKCLRKMFCGIRFTTSVTTPACGETDCTPPYSNMLAKFSTDADETAITSQLKELETRLGDSPTLRQQGRVMMDIDIMEYDGERRHLDDWQRPYVKILVERLEIIDNR